MTRRETGPDHRLLRREPAMGRSRLLIECLKCGTLRWVYAWSWAGHGAVKCLGCGAKMFFGNGENDRT